MALTRMCSMFDCPRIPVMILNGNLFCYSCACSAIHTARAYGVDEKLNVSKLPVDHALHASHRGILQKIFK